MAQLLCNDVLPSLRSPDAAKRQSAEAALEKQTSVEPYQVVVWLLERLTFAADMPDRQMAAVLLERRLPALWSSVTPEGKKQSIEALMNVLQKDTSRPVLRVTASALVCLASAQVSDGHATFIDDIIMFVGNLLNATADLIREVGCIVLSDVIDRLHERIPNRSLKHLQASVQLIILNSLPSHLQLAAVSCLRCIAVHETSLPLTCVAQLAQTLLGNGVDSDLKEEILRSCFEALAEERSPQTVSLEVAIREVGLPRQSADERTQSQAIRVLTAAAKRCPQLFGAEARRSCVHALCGLCLSADSSDDSDLLNDAALDGISTLAEALGVAAPLLQQEQDSTVLALCWAFANAAGVGSVEVQQAGAIRCLAAAMVGTFRAAGKHVSHGGNASSIRLPHQITSAHDMLMPFTVAMSNASAVVRCAALDGLIALVEQESSLNEIQIWAPVEDAIRKCLVSVAQDADATVQNTVVRMVRSIVFEVKTERVQILLGCIVPAMVSLAQKAVPAGFASAVSSETDWTATEDRLKVVASIAELAGPSFFPHAVETATSLLHPLLFTPAVPLAVKLVALQALGPVLASAGAPTLNGPGSALLPFWKDGMRTAAEALQSGEARAHSLGFYATLATIFRGGQDSVALLQDEAMAMVPLDLVASAALTTLSVRGATGEVGSDCEKTWCAGAATAILQGGARSWVRTQAHEDARNALLALRTCALSNGQSFLKVMPQILPVLAPRFTVAASPPIRLASLALLEVMGKMVGTAADSGNGSAEESVILQNLSVGIIRAVAGTMTAEPRSAPVCHQGRHVLSSLRASCGKWMALVEHVVKGLEADKHHHHDDHDSEDDDDLRVHGHRVNGFRIAKKGG